MKLRSGSYPKSVILSSLKHVFCSLQENGSKKREKKERKSRQAFVVTEYVHKISHAIKKVARSFDLEVLFNYPNKLSMLPIRVGKENWKCKKKHLI